MQLHESAKPRARAKVACKLCNSRRVRCNAVEKRPCDNCEVRGASCDLVNSRRGRRPTPGNEGRLGHRASNPPIPGPEMVESASSAGGSVRHMDGGTAHPAETVTNGNDLEGGLDWQQTTDTSRSSQSPRVARTVTTPSTRSGVDTQSTVFLGESSSLSWANESVNQPGSEVGPNRGSIRLSFPAPPEQGSEISTSALAQAGRKVKRLKHLEKLGAFTFPSDESFEEILLAYFKWFHPCFPIIDRPSFSKAFISSTYCDLHSLRSLGFADQLDARSSFYCHAKDLYDADYEEDKFVIIQALFLMSFWRAGPQLEKDSRHWLAAAIHLAQTQGVHRSRLTTTNQSQLRLRKRTWWTIYVRDRQCSTAVGLPWFIRDEDCDVDELTISDIEEEDIPDAPKFLQPQTPEQIQYPIQMAKLAKIMGYIMSTEFQPFNRQSSSSERAKVKERLLRWESELPPEMALSHGIGSRLNFFANVVHSYYNNLHILLYRSAYVRGKEGEGKGEGQIALQAACRITSIAEDMLSQDLVRYANTHLITCFFNSLCIHTISLRRSSKIARQVAENRAQICLLGLKELKKTWDVNNWILRLFFQNIEKPITRRLQVAGGTETPDQQGSSTSEHDYSVEGSFGIARNELVNVDSANLAQPGNLPDYSQPSTLGFEWASASQFFNSKEAENFSMFQLDPNLLNNEDFDFTAEPDLDFVMPNIGGSLGDFPIGNS